MPAEDHPYLLILVLLVAALVFALVPLGLARLWARKLSPAKPGGGKNATYECGLESKGDAWGRLKVEYFAKTKGRIKYPEDIAEIIQKIAFLVDTEGLPTDFTRFRRMTERRGSLGEMSKEQAALIGAALKLIEI